MKRRLNPDEKNAKNWLKSLGKAMPWDVDLDMFEVRQSMSTLYGIYLSESWKPKVVEDPIHPDAGDTSGKRRKHRNVVESKQEEEFTKRTLRVQSQIRCNRQSDTCVPEIRLSGLWLGRLGFEAGQRVKVSSTNGRLVIELDEDASTLNC